MVRPRTMLAFLGEVPEVGVPIRDGREKGQPSINLRQVNDGRQAPKILCQAVATVAVRPGDPAPIMRDDGFCSLAREIALGHVIQKIVAS